MSGIVAQRRSSLLEHCHHDEHGHHLITTDGITRPKELEKQFSASAETTILKGHYNCIDPSLLVDLDSLVEKIMAENECEQTKSVHGAVAKSKPFLKFGEGGFGDKFANVWDWPLSGHVEVKTTKDKFIATFDFLPFTAKEIEARVLCNELMITCCRKQKRNDQGQQDVVRTYRLPLNVDPRSVTFHVMEKESKLRVMADKIPPLELAVAAYLDPVDLERMKHGIPIDEIVKLHHLKQAGFPEDQIQRYVDKVIAAHKLMEANSVADHVSKENGRNAQTKPENLNLQISLTKERSGSESGYSSQLASPNSTSPRHRS